MLLGGIKFKMPFILPNSTDFENLFTIFRFVNNSASEGLFFPIMLLVVWAIAFIGSIAEGRPANRAFIFSSFVGTILGILLTLMGFLNKGYIYLLILFMAFGVLWAKLTSKTANV